VTCRKRHHRTCSVTWVSDETPRVYSGEHETVDSVIGGSMAARTVRPFGILLALAFGATVLAAPQQAGKAPAKAQAADNGRESFAATVVNTNSQAAAATATPITITIERWSTDPERDKLLNTLTEQKDPKELLKLVQGMPRIGSLAPTGGVGFDVRFGRHLVSPTGDEKITLLTDRPISFAENWDGGRSTDYPFTVVSLNVKPNGDGTGTMTFATKITMDHDTGTIVLENFNQNAMTLSGVKRLK
jgi:hypothetical protein